MKQFWEHFLFSVAALTLVALISLPSIFKIKHALTEHRTFECQKEGELHLHEVEAECAFDTYTTTTHITINDPKQFVFLNISENKKVVDFYRSLPPLPKSHITRRGPPFSYNPPSEMDFGFYENRYRQ